MTARMAQLSSLHMSQGYRRLGIARRSATLSVSAVIFCRSMGFGPTGQPHPALFELEP